MSDLNSGSGSSLYQSILTIATNLISGSLKRVQDGGGNNTALQLSTAAVKADRLEIDAVTQVSADPLNILSWDAGTKQVIRTNSALFGGFDTGWENLTGYDGATQTYGLPTIANLPSTPQYRIVGRQVMFRGTLCIPLQNSGGDLVVDYDNAYGSETTGIQTTQTGWTVENSSKRFRANSPRLLPTTTLVPDAAVRFENVIANRQILSTSASGDPINLTASVDVEFRTNGSISIISIKELEFGGDSFSANQSKTNLRRFLTSRMNANDYALDFTSWRTATDGSSNVYAAFTAADATLQVPMNVYADDIDYLGGFLIDLSQFSYMISANTSIAAIQAAL